MVGQGPHAIQVRGLVEQEAILEAEPLPLQHLLCQGQ